MTTTARLARTAPAAVLCLFGFAACAGPGEHPAEGGATPAPADAAQAADPAVEIQISGRVDGRLVAYEYGPVEENYSVMNVTSLDARPGPESEDRWRILMRVDLSALDLPFTLPGDGEALPVQAGVNIYFRQGDSEWATALGANARFTLEEAGEGRYRGTFEGTLRNVEDARRLETITVTEGRFEARLP